LSWLVTFLIFGIGGLDFIPALDEGGLMSISDFGELILTNASDVKWAITGAILVGFSGILFLLLLGTILLFRLRNRWAKVSLLGLVLTGIVGIIMCLYMGAKTARDFVYPGELEKELTAVKSDQLVVIPNLQTKVKKNGFYEKNTGIHGSLKIDETTITSYGIYFKYKQSPDSLYHVYQNFSAQGRSREKGNERADHIKHFMKIKGDTVLVDTDFSFPRKDKLRDQDVYVIIEIPANGSVKMDNQIIRLGDDEDEEIESYRNTSRNERGYLRRNGVYKHH
jgi:hypothetical protein